MQQNVPPPQKKSPRARTATSFPSILRSRKSQPSPVISVQGSPFQMSLADIITTLTPPGVLSPTHARALALALQTETPQFWAVMPVMDRLCAPDVPSPLLAAGLEAISAYAASQAHSLSHIETAALFALLRDSDTDWTPETWRPRYKCLLTLTREGQTIQGFQAPLLRYAEACITSAFEVLHSPENYSDRVAKETYIEAVSYVIRKTLKQYETLYDERDRHAVLLFFEGFVHQSLSNVPGCPQSGTTSIPPSPEATKTPHRPNLSSPSGSVFFQAGQPPSPREAVSPRDQTRLPITLYMSCLDMYRPQMLPAYLRSAIVTLIRIVAVHLSPLPRLSTSPAPLHQPNPIEEAALERLVALLTGPFASVVAIHLKYLLASPNQQEALGAFRVTRSVLRVAAVSRMAYLALQRPRFVVDESTTTSRLVVTDDVVQALERVHKAAFEVSAFSLSRLTNAVGRAVGRWTARADAEQVLEEALGIVKDIMVEAGDRVQEKEDLEDYSALDPQEGQFVGTVLNEAVKYIQRMRMSHKTPFLPIDNPSVAPTPLLLSLCTQLAMRLSTPMTPSLPSILLSIASHLTDGQTEAIPTNMHALGLLTPGSLAWLDNFTRLYNGLVGRSRPRSSRKVLAVAQAVHTDLEGLSPYRQQLGQRMCELAEQAFEQGGAEDGAPMDGDKYWFRLCTDELVWRVRDGDDGPAEEACSKDIPDRIVALFTRHAKSGCPCTALNVEDVPPIPLSPSQDSIPTSTPGMSLPCSGTSVLSRVASQNVSQDVLSTPPSTSGFVPQFMAMLPWWGLSRTREPEVSPSPVTPCSEAARSDTEAGAKEKCRPLSASVSLINAFQALAFVSPPQTTHSIRLFRVFLSILENARCPKARLAVVQFLMHLRVDRDHRVYILDKIEDAVDSLAALVDRSKLTSRQTLADEFERHRARSASRNLQKANAGSPTVSRSRSRVAPPVLVLPARPKAPEPSWMNPEVLPFDIPVSQPLRDGIATFLMDVQPESQAWLPVSDYLLALVDILKTETDWDILSYVLCHLPLQLANKHFFCGPKTRDGIIALLITLCTATSESDTWESVADRMQPPVRPRDAHGLVYHALAVLISYKRTFRERRYHDVLVETFISGLNSQPSTAKCCINALSVCAFELPSSITKHMSHILEKLSRLITNAAIAVHILDFVCIAGTQRPLYANFRGQEFKLVFAVAAAYIHYHNAPDTRGRAGRESFALSQHVLVIAYYTIYVWFLAVALPDRPHHVEFLTQRLELANKCKGEIDEPTEVCFDWLARYAYASADPKSSRSLTTEVVTNPLRDGDNVPDPLPSQTWLRGNAILTVRSLPRRGWLEIECIRPSGETRFLCKSENVRHVIHGGFNPGSLTDAAILMSDRDRMAMEKEVPAPAAEQSKNAENVETKRRSRRPRVTFAPCDRPGELADLPDPPVRSQSTPPPPRRNVAAMDPSFFSLQFSQFPNLPLPATRPQLVTPNPQFDALLRTLKRTPVIDTHKIAILYVGPGQKDEREILGNSHGSPAYKDFLESLGRLIRVRDQRDLYTGDIVPETDGEFAYAWWDDILQVVYHTATLMPNLPADANFIYKKRHIGNDKVRIVWNDSGMPFVFDTIASAFNFVNLVIEPDSVGTLAVFSADPHEHQAFRVTMQRMPGMPDFGPIGDFRLVSANSLGPLMRQVSLQADFFSEVYEATDKDTSPHEYTTNWRRRLQYIKMFRRRLESEPLPENNQWNNTNSREVRDFTTFF